jgi:hypothetical protein
MGTAGILEKIKTGKVDTIPGFETTAYKKAKQTEQDE